MKVEDLKSQTLLSEDGHLVRLSHHPNKVGVVGIDYYYVPNPPPDNTDAFDNKAEATKAAALFRAAYEMQQALNGITKFCTRELAERYGFEPQWDAAQSALALSENTNETP